LSPGISGRKEVRNMIYEKPWIARVGGAACAIQGTKPYGGYADMDPRKSHTQFAYEADE
jgi:hypothetical protein